MLLCACDGASSAVIQNGFADTFTVYRAWWKTTYFNVAVAPMTSSDPFRTVPGTDIVWGVVVANWDGGVPTASDAFPVRSTGTVTLANRGDELELAFTAGSIEGLCDVNGALSADDAATAALIFPDELSGTYDPATCTYSPSP